MEGIVKKNEVEFFKKLSRREETVLPFSRKLVKTKYNLFNGEMTVCVEEKYKYEDTLYKATWEVMVDYHGVETILSLSVNGSSL